MSRKAIQGIVIVGGGTAGWMTAAALAKVLGDRYSIRLVESEAIGTVGVGEGSVPHIRRFNSLLQIEEADFVRSTQGTFKLGVQFNDWTRLGDSYVHGFGNSLGRDLGHLPFHQCWIRAFQSGVAAELGAYSLNAMAAPRGKFMVSASDVPPTSPLASIAYAYHFDSGLYARYLSKYAQARGVARTEGIVARVLRNPESGLIDAIEMQDGEVIHGDLYIDCSGFRGLLIEEALETGYIDFTHWLPCDRAVVVGSGNVLPPTPYTRSSAREAGWQWRIPLQHRTGNGYVYSSAHVGDDEAAATLLRNLDGPALSDPRVLRFKTGRRKKFWNGNVVAIGLSGGFMEPLESTGIYLIQSAIARLLNLFPGSGISDVLVERYNEQSIFEFDRIRDFLILHYHATERDDTPFWNQCRTMSIPTELQAAIDLFRDSGRFFRNGDEMFAEMSWVQIMIGQGVLPQAYTPLADTVPEADLAKFMENVRGTVAACVDAMPMHQAFIDRYCKAGAAT